MFQQLIVLYKIGNFVYHQYHWGCTSIYRPLSYPFKSVDIDRFKLERVNKIVVMVHNIKFVYTVLIEIEIPFLNILQTLLNTFNYFKN